MNRAVKWIWEDLTPKDFGFLLLYAVEHFPDVCEKVRTENSLNFDIPHPEPIVKYTIRHISVFRSSCDGDKISLEELKKGTDPLDSVTFWRFNGKFGFHKEKEAYAPLGDDIVKTRVMKKIYDKIESRRVEEKWEEAKEYLATEDDEEPILSY